MAGIRLAMAAAAVLALSACGEDANKGEAVTRVVSTTSFGMCMGYCRTRLEIDAREAVLVRESGGRGGTTLPAQRFARKLKPGEWAEISALAADADIEDLPETTGCPDCADGGAESLTIERGGQSRTVNFEHGAGIEEAKGVLVRVRALRQELTPPE